MNHYAFEYNCDYYYECQHGSSCCQDDYCRCGKIVDLVITKVPNEEIIKELKSTLKPGKRPKPIWSDIENYCIERLFVIHKLYKPEKYDIAIEGGYYGQELGDAYFAYNDDVKFYDDAREMLALNDNDKIRFILNKEYGYISDDLKNTEFFIEYIQYSDILTPIDLRRCNGESYSYSDIIGIYKLIGDKYRIIDGHHRWLAAKDETIVKVICYF